MVQAPYLPATGGSAHTGAVLLAQQSQLWDRGGHCALNDRVGMAINSLVPLRMLEIMLTYHKTVNTSAQARCCLGDSVVVRFGTRVFARRCLCAGKTQKNAHKSASTHVHWCRTPALKSIWSLNGLPCTVEH